MTPSSSGELSYVTILANSIRVEFSGAEGLDQSAEPPNWKVRWCHEFGSRPYSCCSWARPWRWRTEDELVLAVKTFIRIGSGRWLRITKSGDKVTCGILKALLLWEEWKSILLPSWQKVRLTAVAIFHIPLPDKRLAWGTSLSFFSSSTSTTYQF